MIEFRLPSLGSDMDSGTLLLWPEGSTLPVVVVVTRISGISVLHSEVRDTVKQKGSSRVNKPYVHRI